MQSSAKTPWAIIWSIWMMAILLSFLPALLMEPHDDVRDPLEDGAWPCVYGRTEFVINAAEITRWREWHARDGRLLLTVAVPGGRGVRACVPENAVFSYWPVR